MGLASAPARLDRGAARRPPGFRALLCGLCAVVVAVAGCASSPPASTSPAAPVDPAPVVLQPPVLLPEQPVPAPTGPPVLTVTGRIRATNAGNALAFDPATLDALGRVRVTLYEPWVKQTLNFQGVWLDDLIEIARADPAVRTVHITALDDYQVDLALSDVMAGGVMLATRTGTGDPLPVEDGGPTRIVFVDGVPAGDSADQWIWSLKSIDLR